jgi:hypothetical protein
MSDRDKTQKEAIYVNHKSLNRNSLEDEGSDEKLANTVGQIVHSNFRIQFFKTMKFSSRAFDRKPGR